MRHAVSTNMRPQKETCTYDNFVWVTKTRPLDAGPLHVQDKERLVWLFVALCHPAFALVFVGLQLGIPMWPRLLCMLRGVVLVTAR